VGIFKVPNVMSCRIRGAEPRIHNKVWRRTRKALHKVSQAKFGYCYCDERRIVFKAMAGMVMGTKRLKRAPPKGRTVKGGGRVRLKQINKEMLCYFEGPLTR